MLLLALALVASAASAAPDDVIVNLYATVQMEDGYLNIRMTPSTEQEPRFQLRNGAQVVVYTCAPGPRGQRWCRIGGVDCDP
ncbi:MAG: hypothetical protein AAF845_10275 [Bacteroidota bacterium]